MADSPAFRFAAPAPVPGAPRLDADQQAVVDHAGGPLLVLAGPGSGKTTTLVEAIVDRVENRGTDPAQVLALTFSRKAAEQLRDRVTQRLRRTTSATVASTFHSFAYQLVRRFQPAELYRTPLRLLAAPDQDVLLQDLLAGDGPNPWPEELRAAFRTRGFAREVASVLARAREKGLDPVDLAELGERSGEPAWIAAARFLQRYLVVLDDLGAIDYPDLIRRTVLVAEEHREELRATYRHVFVDEYQDTDPSQVDLLRVLAGDGRDLVVVGDPHQSIYGFRGADVRGILDFPRQFARPAGEPAEVITLGNTRRFGRNIALAAGRVSSRLPLAGSIPAEQRERFLHPEPVPGTPAGRVDAVTFDTPRAEAEHIADLLRRAHLEDGVDWSQMAVLVRSGRTSIPGLRRALAAAQVPIEVGADDTPLIREPALLPLFDALRAIVVTGDPRDPADPAYFHPDRARSLLTSPLVGLDATDLRALSRVLRRIDREHAEAEGRAVLSSAELLRDAVLDPELLPDGTSVLRRARSFSGLLARVREQWRDGATVEEVLWSLWSGTSWPQRLRSAAVGGGTGARLAHRDLDAVCALFETAARAEETEGHKSIEAFLRTLAAQEIPADTLADRGVRGSAVRLLTAHRSKGLEWDVVVVAHVQEEGWPDLRRRSQLLHADRIGAADGVAQLEPALSTRELLAEERRLLYVAVTRARRRVVVTAVASAEDDGDQASRFLSELSAGEPRHVKGRPPRPLSLDGLVAELRRAVSDESAPEALREAAAARLARLASLRVAGRAVCAQADPATWWGIEGSSHSEQPIRTPDEPITLRASALESLLTCPLRWFLEREAGGSSRSTSAQAFGLVVHAVADRLARGDVSVERPVDEIVDEVMAHVDRVWDELAFRTPWSGEREREEVRRALGRLVEWHLADRDRTLLATEQELFAAVTLPDGDEVHLRGRVDRLELDQESRAVVVDFKTTKRAATQDEIRNHDQLGFYQLAIDHGAADELTGRPTRTGGAELVQLRAAGETAKVQHQAPLPEAGEERWIETRVADAVRLVRTEDFPARPGDHCDWCSFKSLCPAQTPGTVLS